LVLPGPLDRRSYPRLQPKSSNTLLRRTTTLGNTRQHDPFCKLTTIPPALETTTTTTTTTTYDHDHDQDYYDYDYDYHDTSIAAPPATRLTHGMEVGSLLSQQDSLTLHKISFSTHPQQHLQRPV
jgi:hypothetical protein